MCNESCPESNPCCVCQWNTSPFKCNAKKCGDTADFCQLEEAEQAAIRDWENKHEFPEPPYDYVEIVG